MQVVNFPKHFLSNPNGHTSLLDLFFTATPDTWHALQLCLLGNFGHVLMSVDIFFHSPISHKSPRISFCYQSDDWDSFHDFLRDISWNVFNHFVQKCTSGLLLGENWHQSFRSRTEIPSEACSATITHRNHLSLPEWQVWVQQTSHSHWVMSASVSSKKWSHYLLIVWNKV